ncbi:hypothetical protein BK653_14655 [Pseudomonas brassicacearum]|uniref:hypothetical protein n=1 Tax=Pseudomonas brassicacearum TaxID=930166 RepID=UPI000F46A8A7|nr:hypothetical protein [Pseudomonas brassicacearum]ROM69200.1 hypothetical protein BK653_14655 [Pseudomonas brassicacearum]
MSRSLGLREDQREGAMLVALIAGLFPLDRSGPIASKLAPTGDLDYPGNGSNVGASLVAMGPVQPVQH